MEYIEKGKEGKNSWKRYLGSFLFILFMWLIVGSIFYLISEKIGTYFFSESFATYIALNISFIFFLLGIIIAIKAIHKRSFKSLINPKEKINWKRFYIGFIVFFILVCLASLIEYFIEPSAVELYSPLNKLIMFFPLAIIITLIQTSTEELFFRGYLLQGFGQVIKNPLILSIISGIIFTIPHLGNPEVSHSTLLLPLSYFTTGFLLAIITLKSNSLELALGAHAANNFFVAFVQNYKDSALEGTYSIFITSRFEPLYSLVSTIVVAIIFYVILFKYLKLNE